MQTTTCKRAACGLAVPPYQRAKPIYLPSNATDASRGRPPAFFETLARPSTLRASRLRIPRGVQVRARDRQDGADNACSCRQNKSIIGQRTRPNRNKFDWVAVTKKTHEATGFFFSALSIYRIFCLPEVGKNPENLRFSWLLLGCGMQWSPVNHIWQLIRQPASRSRTTEAR